MTNPNQRDPHDDPKAQGEAKRNAVPSKGEGSDGFGGGGAGTESTRGAHARGEPATTGDDRHPGSGWEDTGTGEARPDPTRAPSNTAGEDLTGRTTNRPGGNEQVEPRTAEKSSTYRRKPADGGAGEREATDAG